MERLIPDTAIWASVDALRADFDSGAIDHQFPAEVLAEIFSYFRSEAVHSAPLPIPENGYAFADLFEAVRAFVREKPAEVLAMMGKLDLFYNSRGLELLANTSEFALRSQPRVRSAPFATTAGHQVSFLISYPRSGNTLFSKVCESIFAGSRHSVFWNDGKYFSRWNREYQASTNVLVKDHILANEYLTNKVLYLKRDYDAVLMSLIPFLFSELTIRNRGLRDVVFQSVTSLVRYLETDYAFGLWHRHVAFAQSCASASRNIRVIDYSDLVGPNKIEVFLDCLSHLGFTAVPDDLNAAFTSADENLASLRQSSREWQPINAIEDMPELFCYRPGEQLAEWALRLPDTERAALSAHLARCGLCLE